MPGALAQCRRILSRVAERAGGRVLRTDEDGLDITFPVPADAVLAAFEGQRDLLAADQGDTRTGAQHTAAAVEMARAAGHKATLGFALLQHGCVIKRLPDDDAAAAAGEERQPYLRREGSLFWFAWVGMFLACDEGRVWRARPAPVSIARLPAM